MSDYSELLKNPMWQRKRLEILNRDNFTCQVCSDLFTNLQVHHKDPYDGRMPWEYPDESMITVCELCHEKEEFIKWLRQNIVLLLQAHGFINKDINEAFSVIRRRITENKHSESARRYMVDIKKLLHGRE